MILSKSPYYITIPWLKAGNANVPEKYILQIFIWDGLKTQPPATPNYEEENINPLGLTGSIDVNVSPYVNDLLTTTLNVQSTTNLTNASSAVWVKTQVIYYIGGVAQSAVLVDINLAVKGYGYGIEGKNSTIPINNLLSSVSDLNVSKNTQYNVAVKVSEDEGVLVNVVSKPNGVISFSNTISITNDSDSLVKNLFIKCSDIGADSSIEIKLNNLLIQTLNLKEELRYVPFDVWFLNKFGQLQTMVFFKESITSLKVSSETFESSNGQPSDGVHQKSVYNKNGNSDFKAKTGFIQEENNEVIKQLLLSDKVWIVTGDLFNPVNVSSSSIEYKSRQKDRLLDYEINFEYAYNEINNI